MTQDQASYSQDGSRQSPQPVPESSQQDLERRVRESIARLADARLRERAPLDMLQRTFADLSTYFPLVLAEEKRLRLERARLYSERDRLRAKVLELRRVRLEKETELSQRRSSIKVVPPVPPDEEDLEQQEEKILDARIAELEGDVDALEETLKVHRRDRLQVLRQLIEANEELQDLLTEALLSQIQNLGCGKTEDLSRTGMAGVVAEFLGRLLVLEKEQSQVWGLLSSGSCDGQPGLPG